MGTDVLRQGINHVYRSLVDGKDIRGSENAQVRQSYRFGVDSLTVATDGHVSQYIDICDTLAEMVGNGFTSFHHAFHEQGAAGPCLISIAVDLLFSCLPRSATNGNIFERTAKSAHRMTFEMGEDNHGIVIQQMTADGYLLEPFSSGNRERGISVLIHDVYSGKGRPTVLLQCFAMPLGCPARAWV